MARFISPSSSIGSSFSFYTPPASGGNQEPTLVWDTEPTITTYYMVRDIESFTLDPQYAYRNFTFEIRGASGGRGDGGSVLNLTAPSMPFGTYYVGVGQAGSMGINREGGFNGGGSSGGSRGNECSGGGATHLATASGLLKDLDPSSVLLVSGASGGGVAIPGGGQVLGGSGGYPAGQNGSNSINGSQGGLGGGQTSGGLAMTSGIAGTTPGTDGSFGLGGNGGQGSSAVNGAGGGGGGGGWYGGAGGEGSDGTTGGGGGGGSSYVSPDYNFTLQSSNASNYGHGRFTISYERGTYVGGNPNPPTPPSELVVFNSSTGPNSSITGGWTTFITGGYGSPTFSTDSGYIQMSSPWWQDGQAQTINNIDLTGATSITIVASSYSDDPWHYYSNFLYPNSSGNLSSFAIANPGNFSFTERTITVPITDGGNGKIQINVTNSASDASRGYVRIHSIRIDY